MKRVFLIALVGASLLAAAPPAPFDLSVGSIMRGSKLVGYDYDAAFPTLLRNVLPPGIGIMGFVLAAIFGAVVSSLASMLNSASTIFTMDIYHKLKKDASQYALVTTGLHHRLVLHRLIVEIGSGRKTPLRAGR